MNGRTRSTRCLQLALSLVGSSSAALAQQLPPGWEVKGNLQGFPVICQVTSTTPGAAECRLWPKPEQLAQMAAAPPPAAASSPPKPAAAPVSAASTEAAKSDSFQTIVERAKADLTVPASPAFAVLGLAPDKIQRPGLIRDFAASLTRGLSPDGKIVEGMAIDIAPMSLFFRDKLRGGDLYGPKQTAHPNDLFSDNYGTRLLARTTLSLATTKPDDNGASRAALGLRVGLWDQGDPGIYYGVVDQCLKDPKINDISTEKNTNSTPDDLGTCYDKVGKDHPLWAQPSLYLGLGKSWYTANSQLSDSSSDGAALWLSGSYGLFATETAKSGRELRLLLQGLLSRRINDRTPDPDDNTKLLRQSSSEAALRLRLGWPTVHAYGEYGQRRVKLGDDVTERLHSVSWGGELRLPFSTPTDEYWLQVASVREHGFADGKDRNSINLSVRFGVPFLELPGGTPSPKN